MIYTDIIIDNNSNRFIERVMKENLWSREYTLRVIEEYKKFIFLGTIQDVAPSFEIDQVWHTHLLFTKDYKKMCTEVIKLEFHHNPNEEKTSKVIVKDPYITTKELYFKTFKIQPPSDIWTKFVPSQYVYIDIKKHWIIPVGDFKGLYKLLKHIIKLKTKQIWDYSISYSVEKNVKKKQRLESL
jgi:hypothetical protein